MKAVVLLSGGLDSATCLYWAQHEGYRCTALSVDYGQRHAKELQNARMIAYKAAAAFRRVSLSLPWLKISSLLDAQRDLPDLPLSRIGRTGIPNTYVPGRNTVMLSLGASLADAIGAEAIVIGANALDYSGYPDCRPKYLSAFERAVRLGTKLGVEKGRIKVLAPLSGLDKRAIVCLAYKLKVPMNLTWSCYKGARRPCGKCDSCKLRAKGFLKAGMPDPAL